MTLGSLVLAFAAGMLTVLSPCVLPILPIVLGAAASERRWGPVALAMGLSISFVTIGLFVATIGFAVGLDADVFRYVAAVLMVAIGLVLTLPGLQAQLAVASGPVANWTDARLSGVRGGTSGQFWVGVLLGAVWSPCVGPTLGAASLLAAQGRDLGQVGITMFAFGLGAALPLLALGLLSREAMVRWRHRLASANKGGRAGLGVFFVAIGALVLTGLDKSIETVLVEVSPQWLIDLTTRF
ncbi:MAG TPA: cytochrome c biogenesis CcdA family protein [Xanthobacteraceae bacterium]|nr:cytochrome c biogenesis CcdA family protein [Xanthobacteraceae bacterium]